MNGKIGVLIGSESDKKTMESARDYYEYFDLEMNLFVMSAHRNPAEVSEFALNARKNGYHVLVGAAGMAAHLAGVIKAHTTLPVIGVPLDGGIITGLDSLLATVQMPKGVPVATLAVGKAGAINAAILSAEILSINNEDLINKLSTFKSNGSKL